MTHLLYKTHCFADVSNPNDLETQDQLYLHVIHEGIIMIFWINMKEAYNTKRV